MFILNFTRVFAACVFVDEGTVSRPLAICNTEVQSIVPPQKTQSPVVTAITDARGPLIDSTIWEQLSFEDVMDMAMHLQPTAAVQQVISYLGPDLFEAQPLADT